MRSLAGGSDEATAPRPSRSGGRGFTLLEILLAVALIGLLSAALVSGAVRIVDSQPQRPEDVFWAASQAARRAALQTEREVTLTYDGKEKRFVVGEGGGAPQLFVIPGATRDLTVDLLPGQERSGGSSILIGGQLLENRSVASVTYYPDGTCSPFRVQFRANGPARVIAIDPWTCAPMLAHHEANP
jgi:general secretion pathway protein H